MKWIEKEFIYLEDKSKVLGKHLERLNNIRKKGNSNGYFRHMFRGFDVKSKSNR